VINPTRELEVSSISAELRYKSTAELVHNWTIAPPERLLPPSAAASFESREMDVPQGGEELTLQFGNSNG